MDEVTHKSKTGVRTQEGGKEGGRPKPTARKSLRDILEAENSVTRAVRRVQNKRRKR